MGHFHEKKQKFLPRIERIYGKSPAKKGKRNFWEGNFCLKYIVFHLYCNLYVENPKIRALKFYLVKFGQLASQCINFEIRKGKASREV